MTKNTLLWGFIMISASAFIGADKKYFNDGEKVKTEKTIYIQEEVTYPSQDSGITIAGTLTMPNAIGSFPAVILVAGMGPNDRDSKPFPLLADYLTQRGVAVLRFDKRGVGKSTGTYDLTVTSEDFANDVRAGITYLKTRSDIDSAHIGLIGCSEGGVIASMVAATSSDVANVVLLAAAVVNAVDDVVEEVAMQLKADGATAGMIAKDRAVRTRVLELAIKEQDVERAALLMRAAIEQYWKELSAKHRLEAEALPFGINMTNADETIAMFNSPWYRYFLALKPAEILKRITVPVLALNGDRDFIVLSRLAIPLIQKAFAAGGNRNCDVRELAGLNHWLQNCKTGALAEYGATEEIMAPAVLEIVAEWISKRQ